jgi:hypothetical protein
VGSQALRSGFAAAAAVIACAGVAGPADAAISFAPARSFPAGDAQSVALGDFNKDGNPDAATADASTHTASVLLGDGAAGFGGTSNYAVAGTPHDVRTGDLTGDGNLDLAVTGQNSGFVSILPGGGNGSFAGPIDVAAAVNTYALGVADLNGDGKADIVVSDNAAPSPRVDVLLGNGDGTFGARVEYLVADRPNDLVLSDVNGDTRPDIVTSGGSPGSVSVLVGNGDGTFAADRPVAESVELRGVAVADFNGDGKADLAIGIGSTGIGIRLGDGTGSFGARTDFGGGFPLATVASDFDNDGVSDVAITGGSVSTYRGIGDGKVEPPSTFTGGGVNLTAGDLNGDALPEVVVAANQSVNVLTNTSTVTPPGPPPLPVPVVAKTANVAPVKGTVLVKQPGSRRFIRLEDAAHIAIGSELDVTKGSVRLESAAGGGKTQSGLFRGGLFKLGQKKGARPITELKLTAKLRCTKSRGPVQTSAKRGRSRQLFGDAHGRFRTRGRHSTATIRGTKWLVKDTCDTTVTVSRQGTVVVRDLVKHKTVKVRTGQRYTARRAPRHFDRRGNR